MLGRGIERMGGFLKCASVHSLRRLSWDRVLVTLAGTCGESQLTQASLFQAACPTGGSNWREMQCDKKKAVAAERRGGGEE